MNRLAVLAPIGLLALPTLTACQRDNAKVEKKLAAMDEKLDKLLKQPPARGGRGAPGRRQAPQRPDPKTVYAVPIEGSAAAGPKHAKVTMIEGFEFA